MTFGFGTLIDRAWLLLDEGATRFGGALSTAQRVDRQSPSLDILEDRLLFSATPIAAVADLVDADVSSLQSAQVAQLDNLENEGEAATDANDSAAAAQGKQIVFIDAAVADRDALTSDLYANDNRFTVFVLDSDRDGVDQISEILSGQSGVEGVHLVSHSENGRVKLGSTWIGIDNMDAYAGQIAGWGSSFADGADVLIYGCDLAASSEGRALIDALGALTGGDVAASDDATGNSAFAGDWELEYRFGDVQTAVAFSESLQAEWMGKLAVITVDTTADVVDAGDGLTSLREAIIAANGGGGGDTIQLAAGTYLLTIGGDDNTSAGGDLDILESMTITGAGAGSTIIDGGGIDRVFHLRGDATVVTMSDITIQGGVSDKNAAGIHIDRDNTLNLSNAIVRDNDGRDTTGTGNRTGGAIHVHGTLNANSVLITGNLADDGAGIYFHGADGGTLTNVTISGNTADNDGGGVWTDTDVSIISSTITNNDANDGGGVFVEENTVTLSNTIIAGNTSFTGQKDTRGEFDSDGSNLIQVVGSATGLGGDLTGVDPRLAVLADNGGSTPTHMLTAGSAAINAGTTSGAPTVDHRGVLRDANPDIGAVERTTVTLTDTAETRVNTTAANNQHTSGQNRGSLNAIAMADNGNYVVVWSSEGQDGSGWGVYGRLFAGDGTALTGEIQLSTQTSNDQFAVTVASDSAGNFIATWTSSNQDGSGNGVYAQRFDAAGNKLGGEIQVNASTLGAQQNAVVAVDRATGAFVIVWEDIGTFSGRVVAQSFDANGTKQGPTEVQVVSGLFATRFNPHVSMLSGGGFIVGWESQSDIQVQKFDAFGNTVGGLIEPEGNAFVVAGQSDLAVHTDGSFVAVWTESSGNILVRRYDSGGNALGSTSTVNTTTAGSRTSPTVDMGEDGSFIVAWEGRGADDTSGVFAQKYNADGTKNGGEFRINQTLVGDQNRVSMVVVDIENYVAVWTGAGTGDTAGIFVRHFNDVVGNLIPNAVAGGPYTINEGASVTLDGSGSTDGDLDPLQFTWDLDNDGVFGETIGLQTATPTLSWTDLQAQGIGNDGVFTIGLRVSDGNGGFDIATTTLTVLNVAPTLTSPTNVTIAENDNVVQTVTATDPVDSIIFSISGGADESAFTIDANTGELLFVDAPDFDSPSDTDNNNEYLVEVTATDTSGASQSQTVRVTVTDLNDNAPVIAATPLVSVSESTAAGTLLTTLTATDADAGTTLRNWTIVDGNDEGKFVIDATSGQVRLAAGANLDFETTTGYALTVTVSDGVNTSLVQSVSIAVVDENDNAPVIAATPLDSVSESAAAGTLLTTLTATDADAGTTLRDWTIVDGNNEGKFVIDATSGQVRLAAGANLDFETTTGYALTVTVSDGVNTSMVQSVSIAVVDENDNAPVIATGLEFSTIEISPDDTLIGMLTASDADAGTTFQNWTIVGGNTGNAFALDTNTGELRVRSQAALDADTIPVYTLQVTVSDGANVSAVETVIVNVTRTLPPVAGDDSFTVDEGGTLNVDVVDDWHNASWHRRQELTFDNSASGGNLTDFSVLVKLHASATDAISIDYAATQDQGQDLRFVDSDGTLLSHEIQAWDETGYSYVWVRVPQIDAGSVTDSIWMYFDNPDATAVGLPSDAWMPDDVAVLHLDGNLDDSSGFANDGTGNAGTSVAGQVGGAAKFNGKNDTVSLGSDSSLDNIFAGGGSVSVWINADGFGEGKYGRIVDKSSSTFSSGSSNGDGWALQVGKDGGKDGFLLFNQGFTGLEGEWRTDPGSIQLDTWHHIALVYDSNSSLNDPQIYIDGVLQNLTEGRTPVGTARSDASIDMTVGNFAQGTTRTFDGLIDELRISNSIRSADEINAERLQALGGFLTSGPSISGPGGLLQNDRDPEGQSMQTSLLAGPAHAASFSLAADGSFTYVHDGSETTTDTFTYTVTDLSGVSSVATVRLTITPVNDAPTANAGGTYTIAEGDALNLDGSLSSDADDVVLTYQWDLDGDGIFGEPGEAGGERPTVDWATLQSLGIDDGSFTIRLRVTDAGGLTSAATTTLIVTNTAPVSVNDAGVLFTTDEDTTLITGNVLVNDNDVNVLDTITLVSFDASGLRGTLTNRGDGTFLYDPNGKFESLGQGAQFIETFTYTISDGDGGFSTAVATILVKGVNDNPVVQVDGVPISYTENQGPVPLLDSLTVTDVDSPTLQSARIWFASGYAGSQDKLDFIDTANITGNWDAATSTLTLVGVDTAENYAAAVRSVQYRNLSEAPSETTRVLSVEFNDGVGVSQSASRNLAVTAVNDRPVAQNDAFEVVGGEMLNSRGILQNDVDVDGDVLTARLVSGPSNGTLILQSDGSFTYQPDLEFAGIDRFTYIAFDGTEFSEVREVVISIAAANLSGGTGSVGDSNNSSSDSSNGSSSKPPTDSANVSIVESALAAGNLNASPSGQESGTVRVEASGIEILEDLNKSDDDDAAMLGVVLGDDEQFSWAPQVQRQTLSLHRDIEKTVANDVQSFRNDDANHLITLYDFIAQPGTAWQEMDAFRSQIDGQLFGNAITVTTVGITSSSFALGYITWVMRSGFILTGLLANMPVWRSFDPLVVISGMSHEGNAETIQQIISREKQNLDESATR